MEIAAYFLMEPPIQKPTDNPGSCRLILINCKWFTVLLKISSFTARMPVTFVGLSANCRWFRRSGLNNWSFDPFCLLSLLFKACCFELQRLHNIERHSN